MQLVDLVQFVDLVQYINHIISRTAQFLKISSEQNQRSKLLKYFVGLKRETLISKVYEQSIKEGLNINYSSKLHFNMIICLFAASDNFNIFVNLGIFVKH